MTLKPTDPISGTSLAAQNCSESGGGLFPKSKAHLLKELLKDPNTYEQLDSAWRLAMWLMLVETGVVVSSYEQIARQLGSISKSTVRKWVDTLVGKGVMQRKQKGNEVELRLLGDYMQVASASSDIHVPCQVESPVPAGMLALTKIIEGTEELGGQIAIRIDGLRMGTRKC